MDELIEVLLDAEKASTLIQNIASYIVYIYPGIISIYAYNFFNAKTTHTTQVFIFKSFAISYLYNLIFGKMFLVIKVHFTSIGYNLLLIAISFIAPYVFQRFKNSEMFARICNWFKINTSVTDVPFELLEDKGERSTCLKVYLCDAPYVYVGFISEYEYESENNKYLILCGYKKYLVKKNSSEKLLIDNKAEQYDEKVYIKLSNVKLIEKISEKRANEEIYAI